MCLAHVPGLWDDTTRSTDFLPGSHVWLDIRCQSRWWWTEQHVLRCSLYNHPLILSTLIFGHLPEHLAQPCNHLLSIRSVRAGSKCNPLLSSGYLPLEGNTNLLTTGRVLPFIRSARADSKCNPLLSSGHLSLGGPLTTLLLSLS